MLDTGVGWKINKTSSDWLKKDTYNMWVSS